MKDSKVGIIIICIIVVLGIVILNLKIKNNGSSPSKTNNTRVEKKVYKGFDYEKLGTNAEKIAYTNLDTENLRKLFINHLLRANVLDEDKLEDFKLISVSQEDNFRYIATGSFKCNNQPNCYVDYTGDYTCLDTCLNIPIDEYDEKTGYYDFRLVFDVKLDDKGVYTFDGFKYDK